MILRDKKFIRFILIFAAVFAFCYYGAQFITGITVPGGRYNPFIEKYLNFTAWLRTSLIYGSKLLLSLFGTQTYREGEYVLRATEGKGIRLVYGCLGFSVNSFWVAYIVATAGALSKKVWWFFGGLILIWLINVTRLSLVLMAHINGWDFPLGMTHHDWFNIITYICIFIMMYFFERNIKSKQVVPISGERDRKRTGN